MKRTFTQMLSLAIVLFGLQTMSAQEQILTVNAPTGISGVLEMGEAGPDAWAGALNVGEEVTGDVAYVSAAVVADDEFIDDTPVNGCVELGNPDDVMGKIALVERGVCSFSAKVNWAQEAGAIGVIICNNRPESADGGGIINMAASDPYMMTDEIPAGFLSQEDCAALRLALDNDEVLNVTMGTKVFTNLISGNTYRTPLSAATTLSNMGVTIFSIEETEATVTWVVTDPVGTQTSITTGGTVDIAGVSFLPDPGTEYTPSMMGIHTVSVSNDINEFVLETTFDITADVFSIDDGVVTTSGASSVENFTMPETGTPYRTDVGMLMTTGDTELELLSIEFGLSNWVALQEGATGEINFNVVIVPAPVDADGNVEPITNGTTTYDGFEAPVAFTIYSPTGNEADGDIVTVEGFFLTNANPNGSPLFRMQPNQNYYVFIQFDGTEVGNDVPPSYLLGREINHPQNQTPVVTTDWFNAWGGGNTILRAYIQDYISGVEDVLAENAVIVTPNPVTSQLNVAIDLENSSEKVAIQVINLTGSVLVNETLDNLQSANLTYDVAKYPAGNYFIKVATAEGSTIQKFVKH